MLLRKRFVPERFLPALAHERAKATQHHCDTLRGIKANTEDVAETVVMTEEGGPRIRPRPVLVLLSRCVPMRARALLKKELEQQFEGLFVRVSSHVTHGVDCQQLQLPLSLGRSVVCDVDCGLCADSRVQAAYKIWKEKHFTQENRES